MRGNIGITPSLEDYLEAILFLTKEGGDARVTDIANYLAISKPSVNKAINTLKNMELVSHEHYAQLALTEKGRQIALDVAKRHIILMDFLFKYLGVDAAVAEKEACLIEHAMSLDTAYKLENFLKKYDAFGGKPNH